MNIYFFFLVFDLAALEGLVNEGLGSLSAPLLRGGPSLARRPVFAISISMSKTTLAASIKDQGSPPNISSIND